MTRALWAAVAAALLVLVACGASDTARHPPRVHPSQSTRSPAPAVSPPPSQSAAPTSGPVPAPTATIQIPQHQQELTLSGAVTGTVASAEIKECGTGNGAWALELSSMTVDGGTASLTLLVSSYKGAGSYQPGGALNAILNQQLTTYPVTGGSVDIANGGAGGQMDLKLTSSSDQQVQIQGSWACA